MAENLTGPPAREPRVPITVLIRPSSKDWIDRTAKHHGLSRSDVIRASLAVAVKNDRELVATLKSMGESS